VERRDFAPKRVRLAIYFELAGWLAGSSPYKVFFIFILSFFQAHLENISASGFLYWQALPTLMVICVGSMLTGALPTSTNCF
jgi:hypothetical protein